MSGTMKEKTSKVKQVADDIYEVKLPLKGSSLKELSSYIIKGQDRSCIIDVGFETEECTQILLDAAEELGLCCGNTDILLTHSHRDHCGNLPNLYRRFGRIVCSVWDGMEITWQDPKSRDEYMRNSFLKCGISLGLLKKMPPQIDVSVPIPSKKVCTVAEQDVLSYGKYRFRVIDLKGHMPGMIGFYDEGSGIFFPGDHVLNKITPNIGYYEEGDHSLANYIKNLEKIRDLPVSHVFPAHRGEVLSLQTRVDEILEHHRERLDEITGVLATKPMCAFEAAGKVKWYYKEGCFKDYPLVMQWMATSEILAHLQYLWERGEVIRSGGPEETYIYRYGN